MADERRLTSRMLKKWKTAAVGGRFPSAAYFTPETLGKDYPNCVLIKVEADLPSSRVIHAGEIAAGGLDLPDESPISDYPANSLVRLATAKIAALLTKRAPITFGGTGVHDTAAVLYRTILLPLADEGETITHVLGAINFKEISAVEEYPDEPEPKPVNTVSSYIAFSSRRLVFAPSASAKKAVKSNV